MDEAVNSAETWVTSVGLTDVSGGHSNVFFGGSANGILTTSEGSETRFGVGKDTMLVSDAAPATLGGQEADSTVTRNGGFAIHAGATAIGVTVSAGSEITSSSGASSPMTVTGGGEDTQAGTATSGTIVNGGNQQAVLLGPEITYPADAPNQGVNVPTGSSDSELNSSSAALAATTASATDAVAAVAALLASPAAAGGGLIINVTFDQSQSSLPAGFVAAVNYVVNYYESVFTDPITINLEVGYGEINGQPLGSGALGESETYLDDSYSYAQVVAALKANAPSASQQTAYAGLPANSPLSGGTLWLTTAQEKALGLLSGSAPNIDGFIGLSSSYSFSYSPTATPASNQYYFVGVVEHEISEVMGRASFLGDAIANTTSFSLMDLFRYSAPGVRDLTATPPAPYNGAYFSINNGTTNLDNWNTNPNGDLGDWAGAAGADAYLAFNPSGQVNTVTPTDLTLMNVLGYDPPITNIVSAGQIATVSSGQTTSGFTVLSGGALSVVSGGRSVSTVVMSGGTLTVFPNGLASNTTDSGGADILSGGTANGTMLSNGGVEAVFTGGKSIAATALAGGVQYVLSGGTASGTLDSGGDDVLSGGNASGTTIGSGGIEAVFSGGTALAATVLSGGVQYVITGGTASGTTDRGGADVLSGGTASGTTVSAGGIEAVFSASVASSTTLLTGGVAYVLSGGMALNTTDSGGADIALAGGIVSGTRVFSGGTEVVSSGGTSLAATIMAGGVLYVLSGGMASGMTASGAGADIVVLEGSAVNATVDGGGFLAVSSGGTINGATISGATLEIESGGLTGNNPITYAGGAALILDASANFAAKIAGFTLGDFLDLKDVAFGSSTSMGFVEDGSNLSGTLTVTDGTHTAHITLLGNYSPTQFTSASDGHNGTVITDPPAPAPALWTSTPDANALLWQPNSSEGSAALGREPLGAGAALQTGGWKGRVPGAWLEGDPASLLWQPGCRSDMAGGVLQNVSAGTLGWTMHQPSLGG